MSLTGETKSRCLRCFVHALLTLVCVVGCSAGSGEGLNISGRPLSEGGDIPLMPTLASVQANIFDPACIICHAGAKAPLGLRLDAAGSFTNLVGVPSQESASTLRVNPGDPDGSYLIQKLEGNASEGEQMPLGGPPIPQATINFVRQWISDGALDTASATSTAAPTVISLQPGPDSVVATWPAQILVGFDQAIDASTVNVLTIELLRSGGDGLFDNGDDEILVFDSIELSMINPRLAILDLTGVTPTADIYRLTLRGSGASVILGNTGVALDGEYTGTLPSGDGIAGGYFIAEFSLR